MAMERVQGSSPDCNRDHPLESGRTLTQLSSTKGIGEATFGGMMIVAVATGEAVKNALLRRSLSFRVLILLVCLAACRRGRAAMSYAASRVLSPLSLLLWSFGLRRRGAPATDLPLQDPDNWRLARQRKRTRWPIIGRGRSGSSSCGNVGREQSEARRDMTSVVRAAALGEGGRSAAFSKLQELQIAGSCCDVTLTVSGRSFKAHKCLLAAQSAPLRAMFEGAFKEGKEDVIALCDVDAASFSLLLDFWYGCEVELNADNVEPLLELSARYGVTPLRRHCCSFVAQSAMPTNVCALLAVADRYDCRRLRRHLLAYTLHCFSAACCSMNDSGGFRQLPLALVTEVLADDRLTTGSDGEVSVFWAAASWLEADPVRRRHADEVLSFVRFGLISAKILAEAVEAHPLVQTKAGKAFVHEAYRYLALPHDSRSDFAKSMSTRARPRAASRAVMDSAYLRDNSRRARFRSDFQATPSRCISDGGSSTSEADSEDSDNGKGSKCATLNRGRDPGSVSSVSEVSSEDVSSGANAFVADGVSGECGKLSERMVATKLSHPTPKSWDAGLRTYV